MAFFSLQFDAHVTKLWLPYDDDDAFKKKILSQLLLYVT